jgi:hypothetical protein
VLLTVSLAVGGICGSVDAKSGPVVLAHRVL